jgi:hypothetical protein
VIASLTLAFVVGLVVGAIVMLCFGAYWARRAQERTFERVLLVDEDFEWNHPDIAKLIMGSRPIRQMH